MDRALKLADEGNVIFVHGNAFLFTGHMLDAASTHYACLQSKRWRLLSRRWRVSGATAPAEHFCPNNLERPCNLSSPDALGCHRAHLGHVNRGWPLVANFQGSENLFRYAFVQSVTISRCASSSSVSPEHTSVRSCISS